VAGFLRQIEKTEAPKDPGPIDLADQKAHDLYEEGRGF
jgi:hypothetical protein